MIRKKVLLFVLVVFSFATCMSQPFIKTSDLFQRSDGGRLNVIQDPAVDTMISRYIAGNRKLRTIEGTPGMQGYRIQIYYSSVRSARDESAKVRANFINKFPEIVSYAQYQEPGWFIVRVGNYRTKTECYKDLILIRNEFPNAYWIPAVINFPELNNK
jgi:hypothetical protein